MAFFPMRPDSCQRSNESQNNNDEIAFISKNETCKNNKRDIFQKIDCLNLTEPIGIKSTIKNEVYDYGEND